MNEQFDFFALLDVVAVASDTVVILRPRRRLEGRRRKLDGKAEAIVLPSWRLALTRAAAAAIVARPPEKQWWHRRDQLKQFLSHLRAAGLSTVSIDQETTLFLVNLESEMRRAIIMQILHHQHG